jgi:hypothetical protein
LAINRSEDWQLKSGVGIFIDREKDLRWRFLIEDVSKLIVGGD